MQKKFSCLRTDEMEEKYNLFYKEEVNNYDIRRKRKLQNQIINNF